MITHQQLEEMRADDAALGDDLRFHAEVYTHRRQLLELVTILMEPAQPAPAEESIPLVVCRKCFLVYGAQRDDCPGCGAKKTGCLHCGTVPLTTERGRCGDCGKYQTPDGTYEET